MVASLVTRWGLLGLYTFALASVTAQSPAGATMAAGDVYQLPAGAVIPNDLYVIANEVVIEGTVQGHLAIIARRARVNGPVTGSTNVIAARIELQAMQRGLVRTIGAAELNPAPNRSSAAVAGGLHPVGFALTAPAADLLAQTAAVPWWRSTLPLLVGFAALSSLLLALVPQALIGPATALRRRPWRALITGLLTAQLFLFVPLGTIFLAVAMAYFWGWFPAVLLTGWILMGFGLLWFLSPLITGVWVGRQLNGAIKRAPWSRPLLIVGVVLLALLGQIPGIGWLVQLASFVFAVGAIATPGTVATASIQSQTVEATAPAAT